MVTKESEKVETEMYTRVRTRRKLQYLFEKKVKNLTIDDFEGILRYFGFIKEDEKMVISFIDLKGTKDDRRVKSTKGSNTKRKPRKVPKVTKS